MQVRTTQLCTYVSFLESIILYNLGNSFFWILSFPDKVLWNFQNEWTDYRYVGWSAAKLLGKTLKSLNDWFNFSFLIHFI